MISINDFIKSKQNLAASTLKHYKDILNDFVNFLNKNSIVNIEEINKKVFISYINLKNEKVQSIYSKKIIINTVKQFLRYEFEQKGLEFLFADFLTIKIRTPEILPNFYAQNTLDEVIKTAKFLLKKTGKEVINNPKSKQKQQSFFIALRDTITLKLFVYGGLKSEEVREVRLSDIVSSKEGRYMHVVVTRRNRKPREIPFAYSLLTKDVEIFSKKSKSEYICSTFSGNKLSRRDLERSIEKIFIAAKMNFIGTQGFKHSYAKKLVEKKYSVERMRYLLGYKNTKTVLAYIKIFKNEQENVS